MRFFTSLVLASSTLFLAACGGTFTPEPGPGVLGASPHFVHITGPVTLTDGDMRSRIDHPLLDDNPNAILIATYTQNARGSIFGARFDAPFAVEYREVSGRWYIRSLGTPIPSSAGFNISYYSADAQSWVHTTSAGNIRADLTDMSSPSINSDPDARILTTMRINESVPSMSELNPENVGLFYRTASGLWGIFNQSDTPMPENVAFNVRAVTVPTAEFHETIAGNTVGDTNWIESSMTDEMATAFIHLSNYYNGDRFNKPYGLNYRHLALFSANRWGVTIQDRSAMPEAVKFLVVRFP